MSDVSRSKAGKTVKIGNKAGTYIVEVNSDNNLLVIDTPQSGTSDILSLTTTAVELKVGANTLVNRRYIEMQALDKNVKWGYTTDCEFDLFKNQFFALPVGEDCIIYLKASTGTADVAIAEKA